MIVENKAASSSRIKCRHECEISEIAYNRISY